MEKEKYLNFIDKYLKSTLRECKGKLMKSALSSGFDYDEAIELPKSFLWPLLLAISKDDELIEKYAKFIIRDINKYNRHNNGYVYFMLLKEKNLIKIGSTFNVKNRLEAIRNMIPDGKSLRVEYFCSGGMNEERKLHNKFSKYRKTGEWFEYCDDIKNYIKEKKNGK